MSKSLKVLCFDHSVQNALSNLVMEVSMSNSASALATIFSRLVRMVKKIISTATNWPIDTLQSTTSHPPEISRRAVSASRSPTMIPFIRYRILKWSRRFFKYSVS